MDEIIEHYTDEELEIAVRAFELLVKWEKEQDSSTFADTLELD